MGVTAVIVCVVLPKYILQTPPRMSLTISATMSGLFTILAIYGDREARYWSHIFPCMVFITLGSTAAYMISKWVNHLGLLLDLYLFQCRYHHFCSSSKYRRCICHLQRCPTSWRCYKHCSDNNHLRRSTKTQPTALIYEHIIRPVVPSGAWGSSIRCSCHFLQTHHTFTISGKVQRFY